MTAKEIVARKIDQFVCGNLLNAGILAFFTVEFLMEFAKSIVGHDPNAVTATSCKENGNGGKISFEETKSIFFPDPGFAKYLAVHGEATCGSCGKNVSGAWIATSPTWDETPLHTGQFVEIPVRDKRADGTTGKIRYIPAILCPDCLDTKSVKLDALEIPISQVLPRRDFQTTLQACGKRNQMLADMRAARKGPKPAPAVTKADEMRAMNRVIVAKVEREAAPTLRGDVPLPSLDEPPLLTKPGSAKNAAKRKRTARKSRRPEVSL